MAHAASPYKIYKGQHVAGNFTSLGAAADAEMNYICSTPHNSCSSNGDFDYVTSWQRKITMTQTLEGYQPVSWQTSVAGAIKWYCPSGHIQSGKTCVKAPGKPDPQKDNGQPDCCEGNPINPASGNKVQRETDYNGGGFRPLNWTRTYNSAGLPGEASSVAGASGGEDSPFDPLATGTGGGVAIVPVTTIGKLSNSPIGMGWRHTYDRTLVVKTSDDTTATLNRPDGRALTFQLSGAVWVPSAGDTVTRLLGGGDGSGVVGGWQYTNDQDELESYDAGGRLLSIQSPSGWVQTMHYNGDSLLDSVTDSAGRTLTISYDATGRLTAVQAPDNASYSYAYDDLGNLVRVTYPDTRVRQYIYEDTKFRYALTGIIDEDGNRFATWKYDATNGKAISSEHTNGVRKVTLTFGAGTSSATDAGGATRSYSIQVMNGYSKVKSINETCGSGCSRFATLDYDAKGNLTNRRDWKGNLTTYVYDLVRNLETKRVEASGSAQARTISTEWHPVFRLPVTVTEPKRRTTYSYDANGSLITKTVQATSDTSGAQGLSAALVGDARTWSYTYNDVGQVLSATDARGGITAYNYDGQRNLINVTNALGHVTVLSNYDANGRVGRIQDPNGLITDLTYDLRGWLASRTVGGETTRFDYDNFGNLKKVTQPNGSEISYTYDEAHRLTGIKDSIGNSINFTLDAMGNRTKEEIKDPGGILTRQTTRVFDALNRLKQITGGVQ